MRVRSASAAAAASASRASCSLEFGAVLALPAAPEELADHRQQHVQQHRAEGVLGRVGRGADHDGRGQRGRDRSRRNGRRDGRQPDRSEPYAQARRQHDKSLRLQNGQGYPGTADQDACGGLRGLAAASPADADRGRHRCRIHGERDGHTQAGTVQARCRMSPEGEDHHDRDEGQAQRPQRLQLRVTAFAGARSRLRHPGRGRSGFSADVRARWPGAMRKARRGQPCLHGHSVDRSGPGYQVRHRRHPRSGRRGPGRSPSAGVRAGR